MPWFKHPIRLLDSDECRHLSHLLAAAGDPSPEDAARSVVGLLWEFAARSPTPGTITTPDAVIEAALRKRGVLSALVESGLAVRDDAGLHVAMFADLNDGQAAKSARDRERMRELRSGKASARVARLSCDGSATVARGSRDGRGSDADADADADGEKNSSARAGDDMPCGASLHVTSDVLAARADGETPTAQTSLFDDETTSATETKPKRTRKPRKRADGTAPDTRVTPIIEAWDRLHLQRLGAAPMVRPNYAQVGKLVRRLDPSMTAEAVVELIDLGLKAAGNDADPFQQRAWAGVTLADMLSARRLGMAQALRKAASEAQWSRRYA